jgi:hypothetical protein
MSLLDRIPFLPKHQGKRELVLVIMLVATVAIAGFIGAQAGWLYKDVPTSTPTVASPEPTITGTPASD